MWLAATHYFESEITSWLLSSKYFVRLNLTSKSEQIENIGRNIFIKGSLFVAFDPLHRAETAKPGIESLEQKQSAGIQLN